MTPTTTLRAILGLLLCLASCDDPPGKAGLGGTCGDDSACASGFCYSGACLDPEGDEDGDALLNRVEALLGTNPLKADTDDDAVADATEIGVDPQRPVDTDGDGLSNALESSTADADDDCVVDELDPETRDLEPENRTLVCPQLGACADLQDAMRAVCVAGDPVAWSCALGEAGPRPTQDDSCDGVDDECDGTADEDVAEVATTCGTGACEASGTRRCVAGDLVDDCAPGTAAGDDATCDDADDDCDGQFDEDFVGTSTCGTGACLATGTQACADGVAADVCTPLSPATSEDDGCDDVDDDCDGDTDEDWDAPVTSCGEGACATTGSLVCQDGEQVDDCEAGDGTSADDDCDGVDDDCDGATDDEYAPTATACGAGVCAAVGLLRCIEGELVNDCTVGTGSATDATCDGRDDDCDTVTDDEVGEVVTNCGTGACARTGWLRCTSGELRDDCAVGSSTGNDTDCDDVDDDCDGETDDGYAVTTTSCGVGACASTGQRTCVEGQPVDDCQAGSGTTADADCDGVDDDCDGATDDDWIEQPSACGTGACAAAGVFSCVDGEVVDTCAALGPTGTDDDCDGVDDDCDDATDEAWDPNDTSCGVGACAAVGQRNCVEGALVDTCVAGTPAANDSSCDGVDNDCAGGTDEDYVPSGTSCGTGACAAIGQNICVSGSVQNTCAAGTPAANDASCNGVDNDCSGQTDEDYVPSGTSCGAGACAAIGQNICVSGSVQNTCTAGTPAANDASCNGVDNDCAGGTDEDYVPSATSCGTGACAAVGQNICVGGSIQNTCTAGTPAANDASCNGVDNDCSGQTDEDYVPSATSCGTGACVASGQNVCVAGSPQNTCTPKPPGANDRICNGIDDDCAGGTDEDYIPLDTTCGEGVCAAEGLTSCVAGEVEDDCEIGLPDEAQDVTCDDLDGDCDGDTDESYVSVSTSCGTGACAGSGVTSCVAGDIADSCSAGGGQQNDADCDGVDDDCNGQTDEDYIIIATSCGVGACVASGQRRCVLGAEQNTCVPGTPAANDATCNGVDNDCSGATDEDYAPTATSCGTGACAASGQNICVAGSLQNTCTPGTPAANDNSCNGVDNDCSGQTDEDYVLSETTCGVGACRSGGQLRCVSGAEQNTCVPGTPAANDATCNGVDNDCSGATDEDYVITGSSCGVGACAATGQKTCVAGSVQDSCTQGQATSDANCNGVDNDCDGSTDEHYVITGSTCGVGACAATGQKTCVAGSVQDSCTQGSPTSDANCNGVDNDCDASTDEHYVITGSSCGVGACAATGQKTCVSGSVQDSCTPGAPSSDANCNGVDNDCGGGTDEDYVVTSTSCGTGACAATGQKTCVAGSEQNSCTPGTPAANDASCNGVDNDCANGTDEDYVPTNTNCGTGACAATGQNICSGGSVTNTCTPGTPAANDASCNNVDNDCASGTDEDYSSVATSCGVGACAATGSTSCQVGQVIDSCDPLDPNCTGKVCGSDGCGGSCGTCPPPAASCLSVSCNGSGQCVTTVNAGFCYIGGACIGQNVNNPSNICQACLPATSQSAYSNKANGVSCDTSSTDCVARVCDGAGTCTSPAVPDLQSCNDGNGSTIADLCLAASCHGFFSKTEPLVGTGALSEAYFRGSLGPTSTAVTGVYRWRTSAAGDFTGLSHYVHTGTAPTGVSLGQTASNGLIALASGLAVNYYMWQYVGSAWTDSYVTGSLRSAYMGGVEFPPSTERFMRIQNALQGNQYAFGVGRNNTNSQLWASRCTDAGNDTAWSCGGSTIATNDAATYPVQLVKPTALATAPFLFVNAGTSRTAPTQMRVLKYTNSTWTSDAALTRTATKELMDVVLTNSVYVGVGATNLLWALSGTTYTDIQVPSMGSAYSFISAVVWQGHVVVLGTQGTGTTTSAALAYCPVASLTTPSAWKYLILWNSQSQRANALVNRSNDVLYILGGVTVSGTTRRAAWRLTTANTPL